MDEATLEPNIGYARLEADLGRLCAALAAFVRDRLRASPVIGDAAVAAQPPHASAIGKTT